MSASYIDHPDHTQSNAAEIQDPTVVRVYEPHSCASIQLADIIWILCKYYVKSNKPWTDPLDPNTPFKHAPPTEGDPWTTLLTPELEADTLRCNAWKDEVQNLLIFAGLFSAVVTPFVIESYKFLQPDPNAAIVGLLFHIAGGLNDTSPFPPSVNPGSILTPFSQTSSAIRINVFWFISLVLSLTTVLVGTIALQWLREHQAYGGYSSKEKLAMLHMRMKAMEAWYLPQVFASLPLLLQAALVLFLAGLIDFSLPLGPKLTIPVSIIIGLTLLFLAATTILPSLQGVSFLCGLCPRKTVPTPCPYKSPQSHAFRTLFGIVFRAIFRSFPPPGLTLDDNSDLTIRNRSLLIPDHLAPSIHKLWYQSTWPTLDREWLSLRDACYQYIFDNNPELYRHRDFWEDSLPLGDVTQHLVEVTKQTPGFKHTDSFLAAIVHCFNELAESIWTVPEQWEEYQRRDRRNNYFEQLHSEPSTFWSLSKFLLHGDASKSEQLNENGVFYYIKNPEVKLRLFSTDQTMIFLRMLLETHTSPALSQYHLELWSWVLHLSNNIAPFTSTVTSGSESIPIPTIIETSTIYLMIQRNPTLDQQYSAAVNILITIFESAPSRHVSQDQSLDFLCAHPQMPEVLKLLSYWAGSYLQWSRTDTPTTQHILPGIDNQLIEVFRFINEHLNQERSNSSSSPRKVPLDVLFYISSIFIWHLVSWPRAQEILGNQDSTFGLVYSSLLDALHKTWSFGQKNILIEKRFKDEDDGFERFSDKWWNQIFKSIGRCIIEEDSDSDTSSQLTIPLDNETENATSPLPATSPDILDHSPASTTHDVDVQLATIHANSHPEISGRKPALNLVNHADNNTSQLSSNLPTMLNHPATTTKDANAIEYTHLSHPQPLSDGPEETGSLGDDHIAAGVAHPSISQPLPSPSNAHPDSAVPQHATDNRASHNSRNDLQAGKLHLAIDVGPPASLERVGTEIPGSRRDHSLDEREPEDAVIHIESPN